MSTQVPGSNGVTTSTNRSRRAQVLQRRPSDVESVAASSECSTANVCSVLSAREELNETNISISSSAKLKSKNLKSTVTSPSISKSKTVTNNYRPLSYREMVAASESEHSHRSSSRRAPVPPPHLGNSRLDPNSNTLNSNFQTSSIAAAAGLTSNLNVSLNTSFGGASFISACQTHRSMRSVDYCSTPSGTPTAANLHLSNVSFNSNTSPTKATLASLRLPPDDAAGLVNPSNATSRFNNILLSQLGPVPFDKYKDNVDFHQVALTVSDSEDGGEPRETTSEGVTPTIAREKHKLEKMLRRIAEAVSPSKENQ